MSVSINSTWETKCRRKQITTFLINKRSFWTVKEDRKRMKDDDTNLE